MNDNDLMQVTQLPIISEKLKQVSQIIDEQTNNALAMTCTEENRTEIKKVRADLNKEFQALETRRKEIKEQINKSYNDFIEQVYNPLIATKFKKADEELKNKIASVEDELKKEKQEEVERYFYDYANSLKIDFLDFFKSGITILLSKSEKNLKNECKEYIDQIKKDIDYIDTQDNNIELLAEYKNCNYDLRQTLSIIEIRHKQIEIEKQKQEELKQKENNQQEQMQNEVIEIVNEYQKEPEEEEKQEEILTCTFTVQATKEQLRTIKQFLIDNKIQYK